MANTKQDIRDGKTSLGVEFGSTRIKAVLIDSTHAPVASGSFEWDNRLEDGVWTYHLDDVWTGLQAAYRGIFPKLVETLFFFVGKKWYNKIKLFMRRYTMNEFIKELDANLDYLDHETTEDEVILYVASNRRSCRCPYCGCVSERIHSCYEKSFHDLPIMGKKTKIIIKNRKFFCDNPDCTFTTFAERFDFLKQNGKKTKRLIDKIVDISLNTSSVAASKTLKDGIADVGKSTICNLIKKRYTPS